MDYENIVFILIAIVVAVGLYWFFMTRTSYKNEGDLTMNAQENGGEEPFAETRANMPMGDGYPPNSSAQPVGQTTEGFDGSTPSVCYPKDQLTPEELLPQDYASTWAKCNPSGVGALGGQNFLDAGHHIGINTVGQTLRNANLQLRSEPPNPQVVVSPWLGSTIEPDTNRRYLEIGNC